jgi:O-6-methylguanine DNA methyltransferase
MKVPQNGSMSATNLSFKWMPARPASATWSRIVQLGNPSATRAVGAANGRNPIAIVVPCHRVIGADGALTGFAGGLRAKAHLLKPESPNGGLNF